MRADHGALLVLGAAALLLAAPARAQEKLCPCPPPSPPPPAWQGSFGGGLSMTGGNTETNSYNLDFALTHDPKTKSVFKADGSYLRSDADGESTVDRTGLGARVDGGIGLAFEKLTGFDATTSGTVNAGESLRWKLSQSASFVHTARALWKMDDFGDTYYHFDVGILASLTSRFDMKVSFADEYKSKPPADKKKNDTAVPATIVLKI